MYPSIFALSPQLPNSIKFSQKLNELESEYNEHDLVLNKVKPLEPTRRGYRLVGGILVEMTVGDILPIVSQNQERVSGRGWVDACLDVFSYVYTYVYVGIYPVWLCSLYVF